MSKRILCWTVCLFVSMILSLPFSGFAVEGWKKHTVYSGSPVATAVGADFNGDGRVDVIACAERKVLLFKAPDWSAIELAASPARGDAIHSAVLDVNRDGRQDFIGAIYSPGFIYALLQPEKGGEWKLEVVDREVNGIHGLETGDVDRDGTLDLIANSAQPVDTRFPESLVWYRASTDSAGKLEFIRHVFARQDAPGLSHYLGFGDINGDGRPDIAAAAKGDPAPAGTGDWFAWWEAPTDPTRRWDKHLVARDQLGATNIHVADVNRDGVADLVATRGHGRGVLWFEGPDWKRHEIDSDLWGPHCLAVADLDGDGDTDAVTCAKDDRLAVWYENDGKGGFARHVIGRDQAAYDIRAVDMDQDGDLDVLVAGQQSRNVVWYENPVR